MRILNGLFHGCFDRNHVTVDQIGITALFLRNGILILQFADVIDTHPTILAGNGKVSAVSGLLNSFTYVGSAISTYGIALLSEGAGWQVTALVWFAIAALGAVICAVCSRIWK